MHVIHYLGGLSFNVRLAAVFISVTNQPGAIGDLRMQKKHCRTRKLFPHCRLILPVCVMAAYLA